MPASTPLILRKSRMRRRARTDLCGGRSVMIVPTATVIGWSVGLVPTNALGSRNASGRISREQTSERIVAVWGKRPEVVARLPIQIVNDKGRYHSPKSDGERRKLREPMVCLHRRFATRG